MVRRSVYTSSLSAVCVVILAGCGGGGSDEENSPPTTAGATLNVNEDQSGIVTIAASDPDGDSLTVTVISGPTKGAVAAGAGFSFTYTPAANLNGTDQFSYRVTDSNGATATGVVNVFIAAQPDAPTAPDATLEIDEDTPGTVSITAADVDGETLTAIVSTPPTKGVVAVTGTNPFVFTFTPTANLNGGDAFSYRVTDASGLSVTAEVAVTIAPLPDAPAILVTNITTDEDTAAFGPLATDPDGDAVTITVVTPPAHGTLQVGNGQYNYAPDANYHGDDSFTVSASDGTLQSSAVIVPVLVVSVNDPVTAMDDGVSVDPIVPTTIDVAANDVDIDGDALAVEVLEQPPGGSVTVVGGSILFTPNAGAAGPTSFRYRAIDAGGATSDANVSVVIGSASQLFFTAGSGPQGPFVYRYDFLSAPEVLQTPLPAGATLARFTTSANGAWLVYVSRNSGMPVRDRLWLKNLDDPSAPVREISTDASYFTNYLSISPDGAIVVFNSRYATTADPATARDVDGVNDISNPTFTHDSQHLYYTVLLAGGGRIIKRADVPVGGILANHQQMTANYPVAQGLGYSFVLTPDETRIVSTGLLFVGGAVNSLKLHAFVTTADGSQDDAQLHPPFVHAVDGVSQPVVTADSRYAFYVNTINHLSAVSWTDLNAPGTTIDVGNSINQIVNPQVAGDRTGFFLYLDGPLQNWAWGEVDPTTIRGGFNPLAGSVPAPRALITAPDGSAVVFDGGAGIYAASAPQFASAAVLFTRTISGTTPTLLYAPDSTSVAAANANSGGLVMANPKAIGWISDVMGQIEGQPAGPVCMAYAGNGCAH